MIIVGLVLQTERSDKRVYHAIKTSSDLSPKSMERFTSGISKTARSISQKSTYVIKSSTILSNGIEVKVVEIQIMSDDVCLFNSFGAVLSENMAWPVDYRGFPSPADLITSDSSLAMV